MYKYNIHNSQNKVIENLNLLIKHTNYKFAYKIT